MILKFLAYISLFFYAVVAITAEDSNQELSHIFVQKSRCNKIISIEHHFIDTDGQEKIQIKIDNYSAKHQEEIVTEPNIGTCYNNINKLLLLKANENTPVLKSYESALMDEEFLETFDVLGEGTYYFAEEKIEPIFINIDVPKLKPNDKYSKCQYSYFLIFYDSIIEGHKGFSVMNGEDILFLMLPEPKKMEVPYKSN